jgi:hypothetical protein
VSRSLSAAMRSAIYAQETGEACLILLTIEHADFDAPLRVVCNRENVTSRGNVYTATAFEFILPDEREGQPPRATLRIDNVDRLIVNTLRAIQSPATITAEVVLASQPDTVEAAFSNLSLKNVNYDALVVEGELGYEILLDEPFPAGRFVPESFPGLFR